MVYKNENFIKDMTSKNKITLVVLISALCIIFFILVFIFLRILIENMTQDRCSLASIDSFTINSGLVLYFHFNNEALYEKNGSFIYDFSGNKNNGRLYGNIKLNTTDKFLKDGVLEFDGIDTR